MILHKLHKMKETSNLTNQQIADISNVPLGTVNRIIAGQTENPSFQSVADIVEAMGGSLDDLAGIESNACEKAEKNIKEEHYKELIKIYQEQISFKNMWIKTLFRVIIGLIGLISLAVIADILDPYIGYFHN